MTSNHRYIKFLKSYIDDEESKYEKTPRASAPGLIPSKLQIYPPQLTTIKLVNYSKMSSQDVPNDIILFHYNFSPFAKRIVWYLKLRGIPYAECIQPLTLPRPDLAQLGINYRRIPLLSIGRDVYYDTRLILARLEQSFPASSSYPPLSTPENKGLEALLEKFTVDAGIFSKAAQSLPPDLPTMKDEKFIKDRAEFTGTSWSQEARVKGYPEALAHIRHAFDILEALLTDGRQWIGGTDKVSLADIHGEFDISHAANRKTDESFQPLGHSFGSVTCFPSSHSPKINIPRLGRG